MPQRKSLNDPELHSTLQPKQIELAKLVTDSKATWIGFGGSRGAAKSGAVRRIAIGLILITHHKTPIRVLIFRRKFNDLWENHIQPFFREWPQLRQWYNSRNCEITFPLNLARGAGSVIKFGYAEHEQNVFDFQGKEYAYIFVDEATHLTQKELEFLKTCNRWPCLPDSTCKFVLTMNPGGPGHQFIKRIFFDKQYRENERPSNYAFIQAHGWDNVQWALAALAQDFHTDSYDFLHRTYYNWDDKRRFEYFVTRTDTGRGLASLPASMRAGHLLGDWEAFAGQYFDIFNESLHVVAAGKLKIPEYAPRWLGIDWGFAHPASVHWFTQFDGKTYTYREYMARGVGPKELAANIVNRSRHERMDAIYMSRDAFNKLSDAETMAQQMDVIFAEANWPSASRTDTDRKGGWMLMYELLKNGQWLISEDCRNLIATLPALTRNEKDLEDCVKFDASEDRMDGDDAADSARYGLKSRLPERQAPIESRIEEEIAAWKQSGELTEMHSELIRRRQLQVGLRAKTLPVPMRPRRRWLRRFGGS